MTNLADEVISVEESRANLRLLLLLVEAGRKEDPLIGDLIIGRSKNIRRCALREVRRLCHGGHDWTSLSSLLTLLCHFLLLEAVLGHMARLLAKVTSAFE